MEAEEQQVEQIKKWWSENGRTVVAGLVIGLGGVFGFNSWNAYKERQAEQASRQYAELVSTATAGRHEQVLRQVTDLVDEFPKSGYAALGSLLAASSAVSTGKHDVARSHLSWAVENSAIAELADVARLRLARVLTANGDYASARTTLDAITSDAYAALAGELRGDISHAKKDTDAAAAAYRDALAAEDATQDARARIQAKLDDIGRYNIQ